MSETAITIGIAVSISTLITFLFKLFKSITGPDNVNSSKLALLEERLRSEQQLNAEKTLNLSNHYKTILESVNKQQADITCLTKEITRLSSLVETLLDVKKYQE